VFATQARDPPGRCQTRQTWTSAADAGFAGVRRYDSESKPDTTEVIMTPRSGVGLRWW